MKTIKLLVVSLLAIALIATPACLSEAVKYRDQAATVVVKAYIVLTKTEIALKAAYEIVDGTPAAVKANPLIESSIKAIDVIEAALENVAKWIGASLPATIQTANDLEAAIRDLEKSHNDLHNALKK